MKPSEQRLILLLLVLVGIFATAFTSMRMLAWQRTLDKKDRSVAMRQAEVEQMLGEKDVWQQKLDFLRQKQPPMKNVNAANKELYQFVSESAQKHNLEINNRQTVQPAEGTYFHQVGETLVIKADGSTSVSLVVEKNGTATTTTSVATVANDTFIRLGFYYDGASVIEYSVNGVTLGTSVTTNLVDDEDLTPTFAIQNGEAVAKTMTVDYIFVAKER